MAWNNSLVRDVAQGMGNNKKKEIRYLTRLMVPETVS